MKTNALIVARYEYLSSIRKVSFWLSTLFLPVLVVVLTAISGYSGVASEKKALETQKEIDKILVVDKANIISLELYNDILIPAKNKEAALAQVKNNQADALIYYPQEIASANSYEIYVRDTGLLSWTGISNLAKTLPQQSGIIQIPNKDLQAVLGKPLQEKIVLIDELGNESLASLNKFVVPVVSLLIFFISVFLSGQFLLQSVSEEKENRMIEIILSVIKGKDLIAGKIIGLSSVVLSQIALWGILGGLAFTIGKKWIDLSQLGINLAELDLSAIPLNLFFILCGFLMFAAVMVGVGSVATSFKDSQGLSSVFIMIALVPLYFISLLFVEPNGTIARIVSYFPLTSPMVFVIRNSIVELSTLEIVLGIIVNILFVILAFYFAIKLFELGSLMYNTRPKLKDIFKF